MRIGNSIPWAVFVSLLAAVAGGVAYKAWPLLFPVLEIKLEPDPDCDLRAGACISRLPEGGQVSFAIEPRDIPLVSPLRLQVRVSGTEVKQAEVDFSGVDMYMGYNRVKMAANGGGSFHGEGRIPVCVRDAMEWEARVLLHTGQGIIAVPYRFITVKPGVDLRGQSSTTER